MSLVYYNENDPFCADWLIELMADGLIAPGIVDRRSIVDVLPSDLKGFTQCHWFSGIGIWSLALRLAGWGDDREIWTGSCPCQPFSAAGKGAGFDDERHLWPHWQYLIERAKPPHVPVVGEQVASKDGRTWLDLVFNDMEGLGHACGALDTCAAGLGAPFIGQRLYWLAATDGARLEGHGRSGRVDAEAGREVAAGHSATAGTHDRMGQTSSAASERNTGAVHPAENRFDGSGVAVDGVEPGRYTNAGRDGGMATSNSGECNGRSITTGRDDSRRLDAGWAESDGCPASCGENDRMASTMRAGRSEGWPIAGNGSATGSSSSDRMAASDGSGPLSSALSGLHSGKNGAGSRHGEPERSGEFDGLAASASVGPQSESDERSAGILKAMVSATSIGQQSGDSQSGMVDSRNGQRNSGIPLHPVDYWRDAEWLLCRDPNGPRFRPVESSSLIMADAGSVGGALASSSGARQTHFPLTEKNTYVNRLNEIRGAGNALNVAQASTFIECVMEYLAE